LSPNYQENFTWKVGVNSKFYNIHMELPEKVNISAQRQAYSVLRLQSDDLRPTLFFSDDMGSVVYRWFAQSTIRANSQDDCAQDDSRNSMDISRKQAAMLCFFQIKIYLLYLPYLPAICVGILLVADVNLGYIHLSTKYYTL